MAKNGSRTHQTVCNGEKSYQVIYIHARIVYKKQGSAVLITIRCEKTRCEKKTNRVLFLSQLFRR